MPKKVYFERGKYQVVDYKDQVFAKYEVTNSTICFDDLDEAVLFCIGLSYGGVNSSNLMAYVNTFLTMIKK